MSGSLPITIRGICPLPNVNTRLSGHKVLTEEQLVKMDGATIIAVFVNVPAYLKRLQKLGIRVSAFLAGLSPYIY